MSDRSGPDARPSSTERPAPAGAQPIRPFLSPCLPDAASAPRPDATLEPEGFMVLADGGVRLHFLDWGGPRGAGSTADRAGPAADRAGSTADRAALATGRASETAGPSVDPAVLLIPGLVQPAWSWAPVARRLAAVRRTMVADLRGHGLSDAPMDGYDPATLAADTIAVAEGSGLLGTGPLVLAGHGFGAIAASMAAVRLGSACAGLVLVDGGWERLEVTTGLDVDEFLRGLDEPPEVLRSVAAYFGDRRAFDPSTWDDDQERAARDAIVETAAGRVVKVVRPHVVEALVRTMFAYDPAGVLATVSAPVFALIALGAGDPAATDLRLAELARTAEARAEAGRGAIRVAEFPGTGHNLMRYRPAEVTAAILASDDDPRTAGVPAR